MDPFLIVVLVGLAAIALFFVGRSFGYFRIHPLGEQQRIIIPLILAGQGTGELAYSLQHSDSMSLVLGLALIAAAIWAYFLVPTSELPEPQQVSRARWNAAIVVSVILVVLWIGLIPASADRILWGFLIFGVIVLLLEVAWSIIKRHTSKVNAPRPADPERPAPTLDRRLSRSARQGLLGLVALSVGLVAGKWRQLAGAGKGMASANAWRKSSRRTRSTCRTRRAIRVVARSSAG